MNLEESFYFSGNAASKLKSFVSAGRSKVHIILDFDRTITIGRHLTVWGALRGMLPLQGQLEYDAFYDKYRVMEVGGRLSNKDAVRWWEGILSLFRIYRIRHDDIEKAADRMQIRPYARELFNACNAKGIPVVIISAGIKNIIDAFNKNNNLSPAITLSTELTFSRGVVSGWKKSSLIHRPTRRSAAMRS